MIDEAITTVPDRQLSDALFYLDAKIAEYYEMDLVYGDEDGPSPQVAADLDEAARIRREIKRRTEHDIYVDDPDAETFEERHAPFGTEWMIEQRERAEGR
jgi:hypothetical protein